MLSRFLVAVAAAALALAGQPAQENLVANLPTSSNANDVFQYTQDGSTWIDVTNEKRIGFTNGIAGWKVKGDESSEVIYTYSRMLEFYGATGQRGADLSVLINVSVNTTYGGEAEQNLAHTYHFTDAWCGTDMTYIVYMQTQLNRGRPELATGYKEFTVSAPAGIKDVILIEQNDIADDWQAAAYGLYDYLDVKTGDNAPSVSADQAITYRYCADD